MVVMIPGAIWITHTSGAELGNARARCERGEHSTLKVIIQSDSVKPKNTIAKKCDTLIITNLDNQPRLMAFGQHDSHISYDGISEKLLAQNQSLKITLIKTGTYLFHDHQQDSVAGTFTVR